MKRLTDLTSTELATLTDLSTLIDLECAIEGAPLLPQAPTAPEPLEVLPDLMVYTINAELTFQNRATAELVLNAIQGSPRVSTRYMTGRWNGPKGIEAVDDSNGAIAETRVWSTKQYNAHRAELEQYEHEKHLYETANREYNEAVSKRSKVATRVREVYDAAVAEAASRKLLRETFDRYLALADGDRAVALAFLRNCGQWEENLINEEITDGQETD